MENIIDVYVGLVATAAPYALVWWVCDMIVTTLMSAICGGWLKAGRVK